MYIPSSITSTFLIAAEEPKGERGTMLSQPQQQQVIEVIFRFSLLNLNINIPNKDYFVSFQAKFHIAITAETQDDGSCLAHIAHHAAGGDGGGQGVPQDHANLNLM